MPMASTSGDWGSLVTMDQPIVGDPGSCTLLGRAGTRLPLLQRVGRGLSPPWTVGRASPRGGPMLPTASVTRGSPQVPESLAPFAEAARDDAIACVVEESASIAAAAGGDRRRYPQLTVGRCGGGKGRRGRAPGAR